MSMIEQALSRYRPLVGDWQLLVDACRRPLPLVVWANPVRFAQRRRLAVALGYGEDAEIADLLRERGYVAEPLGWIADAWRIEGLERPGYTLENQLGLIHVQEEISLAPPVVLDARPGERILDMCAAPGGKTARIALSMDNRGTLIANDVRVHRLRALRSNCERLGMTNVVVTRIDGTRFPLEANPFDRILLDVPCSCEGNLRDTPIATGKGAAGSIKGRSGLQATLLGRAWKLLRDGGTLVYSTCTFAPEENEVVLDYALGADAVIESFVIPGLVGDQGVVEWAGRRLRQDCRNLTRYWPHLNDTGGFTIAKVRKVPPC